MTSNRTSNRILAELGTRVAEDGPAAHDRLLQRLAVLASTVAPAASAALADTSAPDIVRQRALAVVSNAVTSNDGALAQLRLAA